MEALPQIRQTLSEISSRTPEALRIAVGIRFGSLPPSAAAGREDVARYAASLARQLQPRVRRNQPPTGPALRMNAASCYLPEHDEDAHFFHAVAGVIGVADGVGGCRLEGLDAAAFSRGLMASALSEVVASSSAAPSPGHICPYALLDKAYQQTAASGTPAASTAVIVSLAGRVLRWAYVGDSGFAVFRDGRILHRSSPQQSYFNCPFQLSSDSRDRYKVRDAAVGEIAVEEGDVVVVASDGLFDNVFDVMLEMIVQSGLALSFTPQNMADIIANQAYAAARRTQDTPFSIAAREYGRDKTGGKTDDTTVVVAFIEAQDMA
ncbi:hypothetical protein ZWY2020_002571 [Hordeum vulgare]|uniref:Protein phosphatase n=1 Tax=Hordeum vulgare subsp. vulgare TaxID=112509 RepID=A0A8I6Z4D1_HORVV|nr:hypothetical protein ZWY2020_002571 [Hordeum vulgare]